MPEEIMTQLEGLSGDQLLVVIKSLILTGHIPSYALRPAIDLALQTKL